MKKSIVNESPEISRSMVIWIIHSINQLHRNRKISILIKLLHVLLHSNEKSFSKTQIPYLWSASFLWKRKILMFQAPLHLSNKSQQSLHCFQRSLKAQITGEKKENKPIEFNMRKQILQVFTTNVFYSFLFFFKKSN